MYTTQIEDQNGNSITATIVQWTFGQPTLVRDGNQEYSYNGRDGKFYPAN